MKRLVFKYKLNDGRLMLPHSSIILSAAEQFGHICVWALVDVDQEQNAEREVLVLPTGATLPEGGWRFIDTVLLSGGHYVFHVFEKKGRDENG